MDSTNFWLACLIGIVEGITEFLPVSSTGHMILVGYLIDFKGPRAASFEVFIQLGAICSVIVLYWPRFKSLFNLSSGSGFAGKQAILKLTLACLPALILGALFHDYIKTNLFNPFTVCCALIIGGVIMILVELWPRSATVRHLDEIDYRRCWIIGLFQSLALWPGVSRSASTIIGGMLTGLDRRIAAEFSFVIAVPIMLAATGWDLLKSLPLLSLTDLPFFLTGFAVAFVSALLAIKVFIGFVQRHSLISFGLYRVGLGLFYLFVF